MMHETNREHAMTTKYEIQTRTAPLGQPGEIALPWQREASTEDYATREAAEADVVKLEAENDDGIQLEYRVVEIDRAEG